MQLKDVWEAIGNFLEWTFGLLTFLENVPNIIFIILGFIFFFYWLGQMIKHQRAGEH